MKKKFFLAIGAGAFFLLFISNKASAFSSLYPITVTNTTASTASFSWYTNQNSDSEIYFGTNPSSLSEGTGNTTLTGTNSANTNGLVAYWPLDEGNGTSALDASGNGNTGTWTGNPNGTNGTYYASGKIGTYAGYFGGTANNPNTIVVPNSASLQSPTSTNQISIVLWANLASQQADCPSFVAKYPEYQFDITGANIIGAWLDINGTPTPVGYYIANGSQLRSTWTQFAFTRDTSGLSSFYQNGILEATSSKPGAIEDTGGPLTINAQGCGQGSGFINGSLDDIRIYNRALAASEISSLYNNASLYHHTVTISGLSPGSTYYYYAASTLGGVTQIENNSGSDYTFATNVANPWNPAVLGVSWASDFNSIAANQINVKTDSRLSVKAVGDGVTDDTAAVRAAVALAASTGGGTVYFPAGSYQLTTPSDPSSASPLVIPSRVILQGASSSTSRLFLNDPNPGVETDGTWTWGGITFQNSSLSGITDLGITAVASPSSSTPCASIWNRGLANVSELFLNNVNIEINNCRTVWFDNVNDFIMQNSSIDSSENINAAAQLGPIYMDGSNNISFVNNLFTYNFGRIHLDNNTNVIIKGNTVIRNAENQDMDNGTAPESGGIEVSFDSTIQILNNTIQTLNEPANEGGDGEAIMSQESTTGNLIDAGSSTATTATTITDTNALWGSNSVSRLAQFPSTVAVITSGAATGEVRTIQSINPTAKSFTVSQAWNPIPAAGSLYSIFNWTLSNATISGNTLLNDPNGIMIYDGCYNCTVANNTLTNSRGILVRTADYSPSISSYPESRRYHMVTINDTVTNNTVQDTSGQRNAYVALDHEAFAPDADHGMSAQNVEIEGNTVSPYSSNPNQQYPNGGTEIYQEGLFPCFEFGPAPIKDPLTTVFQNITYSNNVQTTPVTYLSSFLPYTTQSCVTVPIVTPPTPLISSFSMPATATSLTVPVNALTATDAGSTITGYLINQSLIPPTQYTSGWSTTPPTSYTFPAAGAQIAYSYALDAAGIVSPAATQSTLITLPITSTSTTTSTSSGSNGGSSGTTVSSGGGGGGGGGGSYYYPPTSSSSTSTTNSNNSNGTTSQSALMAEIATLQSELQTLLQEAAAKGIVINITGTTSYDFLNNLKFLSTGKDVVALQKFLIAQNAGPASQILAKHGTTQIFGTLTFNALVEYQKKAGIAATGYFGPITRAYVNSHQ
jgi:parallel beta-helix repeat protein